MSTRPHHRTLKEHLGAWDADQVVTLLTRRPDLVVPRPPTNLVELAERAQFQPSLTAAIGRTTLAENRLLQVVVCLRPSAPDAEVARALPEGVSFEAIEPLLTELERAALVWRHDGRIHCSGSLRQAMPTTLGPPLHQLDRGLTVEHLKQAVSLLRTLLTEATGVGVLPPPATGEQGRPPRKSDLMEELGALLAAEGVAAAVAAAAPEEAALLMERLATGTPWVQLNQPLYYSRYSHRSYSADGPVEWLFERGLLLPDDGGRTAAQPRELTLSRRGGRPVEDLALSEPALVLSNVEPAKVDEAAAARVVQLMDQAAELLDALSIEPAKALKTGGLGVTVLRAMAGRVDLEVPELARLIELLYLAGLVEETTTTRRERRNYVYETTVGPSPAAEAWSERPLPVRWRQLAGAWLRAERWPSLSGRPLGDDKALPALSEQYQSTGASDRRADVLAAYLALEPGQAAEPEALATWVHWRRPQPWTRAAPGWPAKIGWIREESEALGVTAGGALSSFGRALLAGEHDVAEAALSAAQPPSVRTFTVQADLTAVAVGTLERPVLTELRLMADVESTGAATTFRFSEPSLRRAFDEGRDAATITAFLKQHAVKGIPKPLAYLVADVARRHGNLQVGAVASFVTSLDPAVLADAVSHRRTRKLALRLLAPTVAVSAHPADKVMATLRDVGFLPVSDGEEPAVVSVPEGGSPVLSSGSGRLGDAEDSPGELTEHFRCRPGPGQVHPVDTEAAHRLAADIVAGTVPKAVEEVRPPRSNAGFDPFLDPEALDAEDLLDSFAEDDLERRRR